MHSHAVLDELTERARRVHDGRHLGQQLESREQAPLQNALQAGRVQLDHLHRHIVETMSAVTRALIMH